MTTGHKRTHVYSVRPSIGGPPLLVTVIDRNAETLTMRGPGITINNDGSVTMGPVTARALGVTLHDAISEERSLRHDGPNLTIQLDRTSPPSAQQGAGR